MAISLKTVFHTGKNCQASLLPNPLLKSSIVDVLQKVVVCQYL